MYLSALSTQDTTPLRKTLIQYRASLPISIITLNHSDVFNPERSGLVRQKHERQKNTHTRQGGKPTLLRLYLQDFQEADTNRVMACPILNEWISPYIVQINS